MNFLFILGFGIVLGLVDLYFFRAINAATKNKKKSTKKIINYSYWTISFITLSIVIFAASYYTRQTPPPKFARTYIMGCIFILTLSKLIGMVWIFGYDLIKIPLFIINKTFYRKIEPYRSKKVISRAEFLKKTALVTAAIPFGTMIYGMIKSAFDYKIHRIDLPINQLPESLKGLKIIQISDIHSGSFISDEPLKTVVHLINKEKPDLIFFTGDLVNEITEEALPFIPVLKQLKAKHGIFSILGNHDYGDYFYEKDDLKSKKHNYDLMKEVHQKMGWNLLLNENSIISINNEKLGIIGVENWGNQSRFQKYGNINQAKKGCEHCNVKLLLSHDPSHWEAMVLPHHQDIDVTFSGHTHGMQFGIEIPNFKWSPSQYFYKQWAGLYQVNHQKIYVNRGIGFIGYPGRVGILPEISVFNLK